MAPVQMTLKGGLATNPKKSSSSSTKKVKAVNPFAKFATASKKAVQKRPGGRGWVKMSALEEMRCDAIAILVNQIKRHRKGNELEAAKACMILGTEMEKCKETCFIDCWKYLLDDHSDIDIVTLLQDIERIDQEKGKIREQLNDFWRAWGVVLPTNSSEPNSSF